MNRSQGAGAVLVMLLASAIEARLGESESIKLVASDGIANDQLGKSVSVTEGLAIVGAPGDNDAGFQSGSVYAFAFDGDDWEQEQEIFASDARDGDRFGWSVSISSDTAIVGSIFGDDGFDRTGSAYVFVRGRRGWEEQDELEPSNGEDYGQFGYAVSVSGDTAVIGSPFTHDLGLLSGAAYVFERNGSRWSEEAILLPDDGDIGDWIGFSVAVEGDIVVVGAPHDDDYGSSSGTAYVFERVRGRWQEIDTLFPSDGRADDQFGYALSIDGDTAVVAAIGADGHAGSSGAVYVFVRQGDAWVEHSKLWSGDGTPGDTFGSSVSISGDYITVGSPLNEGVGAQSGASYLFVRTENNWIEREKLLPSPASSDTFFGQSVSVSDELVLVGTPGANDNGASSGAAYAFEVDYIHSLDVTLSGTGSGLVTSIPAGIECDPICSAEFTIDTQVTLDPTSDSDSVFVGWSGSEDCEDSTITMTTDMTCTAEFTLQTYTLTASTSGSGSGTVTSIPVGIECQPDCEEAFIVGTEVTLQASADGQSQFIDWSGDPDCIDGRVTMTADRHCTAEFFTGVVFGDGFESTDTSKWTDAVP